LIQDEVESPLYEASVHRPLRSRVWVATYTGPTGGQVWRSTGLTDRDQALLLARDWEAQARAQREKLTRRRIKPVLRVRRSEPGPGRGTLTQKEVARLLNMSERGVREIEHRALQKLRSHPLLKQVWQQYLGGDLDEAQNLFTPDEIEALFSVALTPVERVLIQKLVRLARG
jgi:hypothetical protein